MCECDEFLSVGENHPTLFMDNDDYGWLIHWVELTKERGYTQIHNYGVVIQYCPFCGKKIGE